MFANRVVFEEVSVLIPCSTPVTSRSLAEARGWRLLHGGARRRASRAGAPGRAHAISVSQPGATAELILEAAALPVDA